VNQLKLILKRLIQTLRDCSHSSHDNHYPLNLFYSHMIMILTHNIYDHDVVKFKDLITSNKFVS